MERFQEPLEIYDYDLTVHNVFLRNVSGYPIPHLLVKNCDGQYFAIPLFGTISLTLGDRQCLICSTNIPSNGYFPYCNSCYNVDRFYGQMCRFDGPGNPFGKYCSKQNPPCLILDGPTGCFKPHYLYVASIGSFVKVGISSERRTSGRYSRLLEQGIRRAVVVRSFSSLHDAMNAETLVAGLLGIPSRITSNEKVQGIRQLDDPVDKEDHWIHRKLREIFSDKTITGLVLYETPEFIKNADITLQTLPPTIIEGEILYSFGKFVIISLDPTPRPENIGETLIMLDTMRLQGYTVILQEFD